VQSSSLYVGPVVGSLLGLVLVACGSGPSKSQALEAILRDAKEDGSCTLPLDVLAHIKIQHVTKAACVPKEGAAKARACIDALVAAGITRPMPESYMLAWPDEVSGASLSDIPAYERRARNLIHGTCVELVGELRAGRFACADVRAVEVLKVTAPDPTHADVRYAREVKEKPSLAAIDTACGAVTRPASEAQSALVKSASGWDVAGAGGASDAGFN
jgi:hypothetical protein